MTWRRWVTLALFGCACGRPDPSDATPATPLQASDQVAMLLTEAALSAHRGDEPLAREAWELAHGRFEAELEQPFRRGCGDRCTLELEYGFGWLRAAMEQDHPQVVPFAEALAQRIQAVAAAIVPEAPSASLGSPPGEGAVPDVAAPPTPVAAP